MKKFTNVTLLSTIAAVSAVSLLTSACGAQSESVESDAGANVQAIYPKQKLEQVQLWTVTANGGLNCRADASTSAAIVYDALPVGHYLDAMSGPDGKSVTKKDAQGRLWVQVLPRNSVDHTPCFVLAEDKYIKPFVTDVGSLSKIEGDVTCQVTVRRSETVAFVETKGHTVYICSTPDKLWYLSFEKGANRTGPSLTLSAPKADVFGGQDFSFKNGNFHYQVSVPVSPFPVGNLAVFDYSREFPTLLNEPALKFYSTELRSL